MPKLTKRAIDSIKPHASRDVLAWDSELRGFGVRMKPSGSGSYVVQYRNSEGRSRRLTLGAIGVLTPADARDLARDALIAALKGGDPVEQRQSDRTAITVAQLCDWYLEHAESGALLGRRRRPIATTTVAMDRSRIKTHVKPLLGTRQVRKLTRADMERFQADVAMGKTAKDRSKGRGGVATGGEGIASRALGMMHAIFEHAVRWGIIDNNPASGVRKIAQDHKRERRLSIDELKAFGKALREASDESPIAINAIKLMAITGFRRMEALALEKTWVDDGACCIRFPKTKSGAQVRVIGSAALKLIQAQNQTKSPFVFPAEVGNGHFIGIVRPLQRVCQAAGLDGVTPHVLRHTFASVAGDLEYSEMTIGGLLGHASRGITQRYVHLDKALKVAAEDVSRTIADLIA
jgi:integrase